MSRSAGGTYTLPGSAVVSGATISSSDENAFRSDVAAEMTDSLSRSGKGAMTAPLELANGLVGTPALSFDSDTDTGLYRVGAGELGIAADGVKVAGLTSTTATFPKGVTATQSTTNGNGATVTGNGTGPGISGTGGATGVGGAFSGGATSGNGLTATATGTASSGGVFTGAGSGWGGTFLGGATGGGAAVSAGGSPTADTNSRFALEATGGHIKSSGGNPASTTGFTSTTTPRNIIKAHGQVSTNGSTGAQTVTGGFNVASAALVDDTTDHLLVTFTTAMADANYTVVAQSDSASFRAVVFGRAAATFKIALQQFVTPWAAQAYTQFSSVTFDFIVTGAQ